MLMEVSLTHAAGDAAGIEEEEKELDGHGVLPKAPALQVESICTLAAAVVDGNLLSILSSAAL